MKHIIEFLMTLFIFAMVSTSAFAQPHDWSKIDCDKCENGIITTRTTCEHCEGGTYDCPNSKCDAGLVACEVCNGIRQLLVACSACEGGGKIDGEICDNCKGNGQILQKCEGCSGMGFLDCTICDGRGEFKCTYCDGKGYRELSRDCDKCEGTGLVDNPGYMK